MNLAMEMFWHKFPRLEAPSLELLGALKGFAIRMDTAKGTLYTSADAVLRALVLNQAKSPAFGG